MRKLLLTRNSLEIQEIRALIEKQQHKTLVLWAIDCADIALILFEKRQPGDFRPRRALEAARLWAKGIIKMPEAKKAAHETHQAATELQEIDPCACAAARVMGHVIGTVHVETHALGVLFYTATAKVYEDISKDQTIVLKETVDWFYELLVFWEKEIEHYTGPLASFLLRENQPNKEYILHYPVKHR